MDETVTPANQNPEDPYILVDLVDLEPWELRRVASPPLGYPVPPVASLSKGSSKRKRKAPYVSPSGSIWSGPFCILKSEQDQEVADSPVWKLRRNATRYPKWKRIRRLRGWYGCGELELKSGVVLKGHSCEAARLASVYDDLPWSYAITLDAPAGRLLEAWRGWRPVLDAMVSAPRSEYRGFWIASHARSLTGPPHAHLMVGGVSFDQVQAACDRWPFPVPPQAIVKVTHRWGALHYLLAQSTRPKEHRRDVLSYCPNILERFESDNLQWLAYLTRQQILKTAARRGISPSARARSAKARNAANARWSRR